MTFIIIIILQQNHQKTQHRQHDNLVINKHKSQNEQRNKRLQQRERRSFKKEE